MNRLRRILLAASGAAFVYLLFGIVDTLRAAEAPYLVQFEKAVVVYTPGGGARIDIPAGSEIDVCVTDEGIVDDPPVVPPRRKAGQRYDMTGLAFVITEPCPERPLFADGFE